MYGLPITKVDLSTCLCEVGIYNCLEGKDHNAIPMSLEYLPSDATSEMPKSYSIMSKKHDSRRPTP